jgi:chemotaxis protein methyltransferase CheR
MVSEEERQLELVKDWVLKHGGMDCQYYKSNYIKRRVAVRMRATGRKTYHDYLAWLQQDPEEYGRLMDRLTINVSQFFRDPDTFRALSKHLEQSVGKKRELFFWSAGCANGEEPYSLAMLLNDVLPEGIRYSILATDIDVACLERAREGIYKSNSLVNVPLHLRNRYIRPQGDRWAVAPELRQRITFQRYDLTGRMPAGPFDVVICRNVLIYFNRQLQEKLFKQFHRLLQPRGLLVLGKTEVLLAESRYLFKILDISERIYERKDIEVKETAQA